MVLNYWEYITEYNQFHKYKTYDDWDEEDEDTELNDYIQKVYTYLKYGKHKNINFEQTDIREFIENCMYDGVQAHMCAYLLTDMIDKKKSIKKERYLKERPESQ